MFMGLNVKAQMWERYRFGSGLSEDFFMAILVFSAVSQLALDTVEEAGVSDLSGRWWSMQIYAARVNRRINP